MKKATMVLWFILLSLIPGISSADTAARPERNVYSPDFSQGTWGCGLDLSVEQTEKLRGLHDAFLQETSGLRARLRGQETRLRELWNKRDPDPEKIAAAQAEIHRLNGRIQEKAERVRLESRKILTPEQQAQLGRFPWRQGGDLLVLGMRGELERGRRTGTGYGSCPRF